METNTILFVTTFLFGILRILMSFFPKAIQIKHPAELVLSLDYFENLEKLKSKKLIRSLILDILYLLCAITLWLSSVFVYFCYWYQIYYWFIIIAKLP